VEGRKKERNLDRTGTDGEKDQGEHCRGEGCQENVTTRRYKPKDGRTEGKRNAKTLLSKRCTQQGVKGENSQRPEEAR